MLIVSLRGWTLADFTAAAARDRDKPQPVSGIGTAAYAGRSSGRPVAITWDRGVSVAVLGERSASIDQMKFLAKVAVGELDKPK